jgi:hypothetical protein
VVWGFNRESRSHIDVSRFADCRTQMRLLDGLPQSFSVACD